ncbi:hypothetical protein T439DRAFT_358932 [Meredithblackwellia eburnea MCA 4105]
MSATQTRSRTGTGIKGKGNDQQNLPQDPPKDHDDNDIQGRAPGPGEDPSDNEDCGGPHNPAGNPDDDPDNGDNDNGGDDDDHSLPSNDENDEGSGDQTPNADHHNILQTIADALIKDPKGTNVRKPDKFTGLDRTKLRKFIAQCRLVFLGNPRKYTVGKTLRRFSTHVRILTILHSPGMRTSSTKTKSPTGSRTGSSSARSLKQTSGNTTLKL